MNAEKPQAAITLKSLATSILIDFEWYKSKYHLDGEKSELIHAFLHDPSNWGCSPCVYFDSSYYLQNNPDVQQARIHPLLHYVLHGDREGRRPNPFFDPSYYKARLLERGLHNLDTSYLEHYIQNFKQYGIAPSAEFDATVYAKLNVDVIEAGLEPLAHYLDFGRYEGRAIKARSQVATTLNPHEMSKAMYALTNANPAQAWFAQGDIFDQGRAAALYPKTNNPRFSIIVPCYDSNLYYLKLCLSSVLAQTVGDYELIVVDDCSKKQANTAFFNELERIGVKVILSQKNGGISAASNLGAQHANGEWLLFLDHDDMLHLHALQSLQTQILAEPEAAYIFSDCAKISASGEITSFHYKAGWDPELLLTYMYAGQVLCIRRSLFAELQGFDSKFDGCQDHDLALRVAETACKVCHIPEVLYYWRAIPGSTAMSAAAKPYAHEAAIKAIGNALKRRGIKARVQAAAWAEKSYANFFQLAFPHTGPEICLIIPTRDSIDLLERLVKSIIKKTKYKNYKILILGDQEVDDAIKTRILALKTDVHFDNFKDDSGKFSFSKKVNAGVQLTDSEYVLLLNDDTEVVSPNWLSDMLGFARMPQVGAVGAQLNYPDGAIQHAGITLGLEGGRAGHLLKGLVAGNEGYLSYRSATRAVYGVTAACLLIAREKYLQVAGFDEERYPLAFNDVDFCAKLLQQGWRNIYVAQAVLTHYEGKTRNNQDRLPELLRYFEQFRDVQDPFRSPHWCKSQENIYPLRSPLSQGRFGAKGLAFVSHNAELQGATKVLCELANLLGREGQQKPLFYIPETDINYKRILEEFTLSTLNATVIPSDSSSTIAQKILHAQQILLQANPATVICNTLLNLPVVIAAARLNMPVLWIIHESEGVDFFATCDASLNAYYLPLAMSIASRVVFVSNLCQQHYKEFDVSDNFSVIRNGIVPAKPEVLKKSRTSLRKKHGFAAKEFLMLNVGTLCPRKAQKSLVQLARHMEKQEIFLPARFLILGPSSNNYQAEMQIEIDTLTYYKDRFHFLGEIAEPAEYYRMADLFVFTSTREAYPTVLTEALAHGLPVLTTPVEGAQDIIFHQDIGRVVEFAELDKWVDFIQKLQDPLLQQSYAKAALQASAALPQWEEVAQAYRALL